MGRACTIPGYALVLPIVGIIVAVSFFHYPNKQDIRATLHNMTVFSTEMVSQPNYDLVLSAMRDSVYLTAQSASLRPRSSWIYEGARAVLAGVMTNATQPSYNSTSFERFPNNVVISAMLNSSNTWDLWWLRSFVSNSYSQKSFTLMNVRPDGLCTGTVGANVAFRGNCSSCSLAMAVLDDAQRAALVASDVRPHSPTNTSGYLRWTTNFSAVRPFMQCTSAAGSIQCPTDKYFGNAPNSYKSVFPRYMSITGSFSFCSRGCFGLFRTELLYPMGVRSPAQINGTYLYNNSVPNVTTVSPTFRAIVPDAPHLGAVKIGANIDDIIQDPRNIENLPTALVQGGVRVVPIQLYPQALNNITPSTVGAGCLADQFNTLCLASLTTLSTLWPEMKIAAVNGIALFSSNSTLTGRRRSTWISAPNSENDMFVLATQSGTSSTSLIVEYQYRWQIDAAVTKRLKELDNATYISLGCLMFVITLSLLAVVIAIQNGANAFEESLRFALEDAFQERLRRDGYKPPAHASRKQSELHPSRSHATSAATATGSLVEMFGPPGKLVGIQPQLSTTPNSKQDRGDNTNRSVSQPELPGAQQSQLGKISMIQWGGSYSNVGLAARASTTDQTSAIKAKNDESMISMSMQLGDHKPDTGAAARKKSFPSASATSAAVASRTTRIKQKRARNSSAGGGSGATSSAFASQFAGSALAPQTFESINAVLGGVPKLKESAAPAHPFTRSTHTPVGKSTVVDRPKASLEPSAFAAAVMAWALTFKESRMLLDASQLRLCIARDDIAFIPLSSVVDLVEGERIRALERERRKRESGCVRSIQRVALSCCCCNDEREEEQPHQEVFYDEGLMMSRRTTVPTPMRSFRHSTNDDPMPPLYLSRSRGAGEQSTDMVPRQMASRLDSHPGTDSEVPTDHSSDPTTGVPRARAASTRLTMLSPLDEDEHNRHYPAAAFVLFDIGFSIIDNAQTTKEYLKVMDMVLSHFGRFGGCVERAEASTVIASFGLHVPCENACDSAVQCAASLLKAMEEKLGIWKLDEESLSLQMFATDYVICVDFGEASRHNFAYYFPAPSVGPMSHGTSFSDGPRHVGKPIRQVVVHAPPVERLKALVPILREQRLPCTATSDVFASRTEVSVPCVYADFVTMPTATLVDSTIVMPLGLLEVDVLGDSDEYFQDIDIENQNTREVLALMMQCQYDRAFHMIQETEQRLGHTSETLERLTRIVDKQRALPTELRQPYRNHYNWSRCWELHDRSDVPTAPREQEVFTSIRVSPQASTAPGDAMLGSISQLQFTARRLLLLDADDSEVVHEEEQAPSQPVQTS